jgi:hypothetical protein
MPGGRSEQHPCLQLEWMLTQFARQLVFPLQLLIQNDSALSQFIPHVPKSARATAGIVDASAAKASARANVGSIARRGISVVVLVWSSARRAIEALIAYAAR